MEVLPWLKPSEANGVEKERETERNIHSTPVSALKGMDAKWRSKADCLSVVTITTCSPTTYVSLTLPCKDSSMAWLAKLHSVQVKGEQCVADQISYLWLCR